MKIIIHINPDKDGIHCGKCRKQAEYIPYCFMFRKTLRGYNNPKRPLECLAAEKEAKEKA